MTVNKIEFGTISHATMRNEDLVPVFFNTLENINKDRANSIFEIYRCDIESSCLHALEDEGWPDEDSGFWQTELATELVIDLIDALSEYAPSYGYFGSHPGDGSDYGFWPDWESIDLDVRDGELIKVNAGDEFPSNATQVLVITDHGNMTLHVRDAWRVVWSIV